MRNKAQKNQDGKHIIVETEGGNRQSYWHGNIIITIDEVMSDEDIKRTYLDLVGEPTLDEMRLALSKINGFAISNVINDALGIGYGSLCKITSESSFPEKFRH